MCNSFSGLASVAAWSGDVDVWEIMDLVAETVPKKRFLTDVCSLAQQFASLNEF